jgi:predicted DNA binding CopG/RHH family protein
MKSTANKKKRAELDRAPRVEIGDVDVVPGEFDRGKFRVTMDMDLNVVQEIRKRAAAEGMKYQPWINKTLRDLVQGIPPAVQISFSVKELERAVKELNARMSVIEHDVDERKKA